MSAVDFKRGLLMSSILFLPFYYHYSLSLRLPFKTRSAFSQMTFLRGCSYSNRYWYLSLWSGCSIKIVLQPSIIYYIWRIHSLSERFYNGDLPDVSHHWINDLHYFWPNLFGFTSWNDHYRTVSGNPLKHERSQASLPTHLSDGRSTPPTIRMNFLGVFNLFKHQ